MPPNKKINSDGMAALLTVLIMASAIFILSFGTIFFSMSDMESGFYARKGEAAFYAADGCLEETLRLLNLDETYFGGTLNFSDFSCIININSVGTQKNIVVTGVVDDYFKKIEAVATVSGTEIILNSWQEAGN